MSDSYAEKLAAEISEDPTNSEVTPIGKGIPVDLAEITDWLGALPPPALGGREVFIRLDPELTKDVGLEGLGYLYPAVLYIDNDGDVIIAAVDGDEAQR